MVDFCLNVKNTYDLIQSNKYVFLYTSNFYKYKTKIWAFDTSLLPTHGIFVVLFS